MAIWLFTFIVLFLVIGMPIAFGLGLAVAMTILINGKIPMTMVFQQFYQGVDSFTLIALPLFILAGNLIAQAKIIDDILVLCNVLVGKIRGGLANANIVGSMFFAGISGSAVAETAAIGGALIPAMVKNGYDPDFSVAVTASASVIGPIIPPSIGMVLYGSIMPVSVAALFAGGLVPGIMLGIGLMMVATFISYKRKYPVITEKYGVKGTIKALVKTFPALLMPIIILGGILGGVFTPTEAAAVANIYALLIGFFYYRSLDLKGVISCIKSSMVLAGAVLTIVAITYPLGWLVAMGQVPQHLVEIITSITSNKYLVLFFINIFLLFLGCIMDANANLLIFAPILAPLALQLGIDPVHFGVIFVLNIIIGLATPPFGVCLFVASGIGKIPIERAMKAIIPFVLVEICVLFLVTYFPALILTFPKLMGLIK
ncbi:TRAP transporter large permease subunit [Thermanaerosceptrum fracticalcis]|uniref:TRAP transporter large permease subunit n=1 Tax=Thermanaerosceptrum fracticalcis TaxID=1712410 RepID=A0A7G6E1S4_THEFR|nr:TRAP transporter large permease [Thermanaerosceptrum fracticalcis]QNB46028.1 TRAP transporter large permease subunit [Thermanaerosceptrum fracticalcis]